MALFKRADLKTQGLTDEQIEFVMTEGNRSLANNYTLTSDVQSRIDEAVKAAQTGPTDIKAAPEYQAIVNERDMLRAIGGEDFASVKPKFRETVFGMLDRSDEAAPVADQLKAIGEKYEEYFVAEKQKEDPPGKPSFGAPTSGGNPTGKTGPEFSWGYEKRYGAK